MRDVEKLVIRDVAGGVVIAVKVVPGTSRDRVVGVLGESLKIATSAAPEHGKANEAAGRLLAAAVGVSPRQVVLQAGQSSPRKEFLITGTSVQAVRRALEKA